ncbi:hypothetical protein PENSPDRAFT_425864 [Peniophora sp. CONT]|nr:hypothetical protein PENSPDRAFT_425864 [Peniophora sp. CONT]
MRISITWSRELREARVWVGETSEWRGERKRTGTDEGRRWSEARMERSRNDVYDASRASPACRAPCSIPSSPTTVRCTSLGAWQEPAARCRAHGRTLVGSPSTSAGMLCFISLNKLVTMSGLDVPCGASVSTLMPRTSISARRHRLLQHAHNLCTHVVRLLGACTATTSATCPSGDGAFRQLVQ